MAWIVRCRVGNDATRGSAGHSFDKQTYFCGARPFVKCCVYSVSPHYQGGHCAPAHKGRGGGVPHLRKLSVFAAFPEHMVMRLSCMPDLEEFYITMNGKESHRPEQGLPCSEAFRIYWQMQQVQRPRHACCFNCNQLQSTLI